MRVRSIQWNVILVKPANVAELRSVVLQPFFPVAVKNIPEGHITPDRSPVSIPAHIKRYTHTRSDSRQARGADLSRCSTGWD